MLTLALACMAVGGCVSIAETAPPVSAIIASGEGASAAQLESGRRVLGNRCAGCHALEPIRKYTTDRWERIVGRMSARARLTGTQRADLVAYLTAARQSL